MQILFFITMFVIMAYLAVRLVVGMIKPQRYNKNRKEIAKQTIGSFVLSFIVFIIGGVFFSESDKTETKVEQPKAIPPKPRVNQVASVAKVASVIASTPKPTMVYDVTCKVVGVSDGDTLTCLTNDKQQIKIRLNQIDAPEKNQDFGNSAKQALSSYVFGKQIGLMSDGKDKYGRTLGTVFIGDKNINKAMVADGMAWAYREYMKDDEILALENKAKSDTLGLWSQPNPTYPSDFRRMKRGEQQAPQQTQAIEKQQESIALKNSGGECGGKRYCKQMTSCAEAKHYLNVCGLSRLDKDGDGVPCENVC